MSTKKDWKAVCFDPLCEVHNPKAMSDQPKPRKEDAAASTGEWTEGMVFAYWESEDWQGLTDAHNAAVADVTGKNLWLNNEWLKLQKQLAAEREKVKAATDRARERTADAFEHAQKIDQLNRELERWRFENQKLREKVQTYEGALIKIANDPNCDRCQVAVDALAKGSKMSDQPDESVMPRSQR